MITLTRHSFWLLFPVAKFGVVTEEELNETPDISPDCFGCDLEMEPEARLPVPDGVSPTGRYRSVQLYATHLIIMDPDEQVRQMQSRLLRQLRSIHPRYPAYLSRLLPVISSDNETKCCNTVPTS